MLRVAQLGSPHVTTDIETGEHTLFYGGHSVNIGSGDVVACLRQWATDSISNINDELLVGIGIMNALARDPAYDSPEIWDNMTITLNPENAVITHLLVIS